MDVVAAIVVRGDTFLAARRSASMTWPGYWEFPGGKVEPKENLERALIRELDEELGIVPHVFSLWKSQTKKGTLPLRLFFYVVTTFSGEPRPREGQLLAWMRPHEAFSYQFLPADAELLPQIAELLVSAAHPAPVQGT